MKAVPESTAPSSAPPAPAPAPSGASLAILSRVSDDVWKVSFYARGADGRLLGSSVWCRWEAVLGLFAPRERSDASLLADAAASHRS